MFKCQICEQSSQTPRFLVIKKRKVTYSTIIIDLKKGEKRTTGNGWEIVKILSLCSSCYTKHKNDPIQIATEISNRKNTVIIKQRSK